MTAIQKKAERSALAGTIVVWLLLTLLFSLTSYLPHKPVYKTVKIQLESPAAPKNSQKREAAPPKAENTAPVPTSEAAAANKQQQAKSDVPAPKQPAKTVQKETKKAQSSTKSSSAPKPSTKPAEQKLQKSVEELMLEQQSSKKQKKEFDWSQFDEEASETSSTNTASSPVSAPSSTFDAFEGSAASAAKSFDSGATSSSTAKTSQNTAASEKTAAALGAIAASDNPESAGNGVTSTSNIQTAGSSEGKVAMYMSDGSARILLEPKEPRIGLSETAAATIDTTKNLRITFTVLANGHVDINSISITPAALVSSSVRNEIESQIARWRFSSDTVSATASFVHTIIKR